MWMSFNISHFAEIFLLTMFSAADEIPGSFFAWFTSAQNNQGFSLETGQPVAVAELKPNQIRQMFAFSEIIPTMSGVIQVRNVCRAREFRE